MRAWFRCIRVLAAVTALFYLFEPGNVLADALDVWHTNATFSASGIAYGNGRFVAVTGTSLEISPDGSNWTKYISPPVLNYEGIVFGGGVFMAFGYSSLPPGLRKEFESNKPPRDALLAQKSKIAEAAAIHPGHYRVVYKHCSEYAHAQPLAVSVLLGLSTSSPELLPLFRLTTRQATSYLLFTVQDFLTVFPQGQRLVNQEFRNLADFWRESYKADLSKV